MGATNRPQELDDAVIRRLSRRVYVPLPDAQTRTSLISALFKGPVALAAADLQRIVHATEGYSGSDLAELCRDAALGPVRAPSPGEAQPLPSSDALCTQLRELGDGVARVRADAVRAVTWRDFEQALRRVRPSVSRQLLHAYERWNAEFGSFAAPAAAGGGGGEGHALLRSRSAPHAGESGARHTPGPASTGGARAAGSPGSSRATRARSPPCMVM